MTGSVSKGVSAATFDRDWQEQRRIAKTRNKPKHGFFGISNGAHAVAQGVTSGISGIVQKPIEGANKEGVGGFFKGMGKGVVGLVAKPVVGVIDFANSISEGVRATMDERELDRVRLPRHVGANGILKVNLHLFCLPLLNRSLIMSI